MASRKEQKEAARQRRLEQERVRAEKARRDRRLRILGGLVLGAAALIAVVIAVTSGGGSSAAAPKPGSPKAKAAAAKVSSLLAGIPQTGVRLGNPKAPVTMTEYGDLQCPICKAFALGPEQELISKDVREGKVQIDYKSVSTATSNGPNPGIFPTQQSAAYAAGEQKLGWNYILLFYNEQGPEDTGYVTDNYLNGLAGQIPGLNFAKWNSDRQSSTLSQQVSSEEQSAAGQNIHSTPTLIFKGPKSQTQPIDGGLDYSGLQEAIKSVS
ncbi:MAG: thioredoxin domain-containing protein [Solirubrobacteraceae bacterium]